MARRVQIDHKFRRRISIVHYLQCPRIDKHAGGVQASEENIREDGIAVARADLFMVGSVYLRALFTSNMYAGLRVYIRLAQLMNV